MIERLEYLYSLQDGWYDGEGKAVALEARQTASSLVEVFQDKSIQPGIFPTVEGGVQFEWKADRISITIEVQPSGTLDLFRFHLDNDDYQDFELSGPEVLKHIG